MKLLKIFLFILVASAMGACVNEPNGEIVKIGSLAPDFTVDVYSNGDFSNPSSTRLNALKGSPAVLVFFNTTCPDCREELAVVQRLYDKYSTGVKFLCVARSEKLESVEAYWNEQGLTLPVAPQNDDKVYSLYAKSVIPRTYTLNSEGVITAYFSDSPVADFSSLSRILDSLLNRH